MFRPDDRSPVEAIIQPDVGIKRRFDHPLWKRQSDSYRGFASPHLRMLEDVFEALVCEPHLQSLKVSQKPHGVVRDMLNAHRRARQCVGRDTEEEIGGPLTLPSPLRGEGFLEPLLVLHMNRLRGYYAAMELARALSDAQVARYHEDGFLCPIAALSPAEARDCRAMLEAFEASQGRSLGRLPGQLRAKTHLLFPWLDRLVRHPAVLAAVEDLIGSDLLVYHLTMWIKEPGDDAFVSWHQDGTYFGLDPADQHVTAWVALTDSLPEMGCVTVLPGSHRLGQLRHSTHRDATNLLSNGQQAEIEVDPARVVPLVLRAGEFSLHHTHLLHSSAPNRGRDRRIGVGISYIPTTGAPHRSTSPHRVAGARRGP